VDADGAGDKPNGEDDTPIGTRRAPNLPSQVQWSAERVGGRREIGRFRIPREAPGQAKVYTDAADRKRLAAEGIPLLATAGGNVR